jgi:RNA polymerase sigma-70 factor, ECF subfamily
MSAIFAAATGSGSSRLWREGRAGVLFSTMIEDDQKTLALGLKRRDPDLLDRLIEQYQYRLFRYLVHLTGDREHAEDFFQETWIRVLERAHQYNAQWKFEAWLFTIARNLVIDWRRKKRPSSLDELMTPGEDAPAFEPASLPEESPLERALQRESDASVQMLLGRVPAIFREVLVLRFQEGMKLEEIASITNAPIATVKSRLYRGLAALRKLLPEGGV